MIVHRVSRRAIQPLAAACLLQQEAGSTALVSVISQCWTVESIVVALGQHEARRRADAVLNIWPTFGNDCLTDTYGLTGTVENVVESDSRVLVENARDWRSERIPR